VELTKVSVLSPFGRHDVDVAVRVGVSVCLPLFTVYAIGRLDLAAYAALGSLTSLYGHAETSHRRFETLFVAAITLVATITISAVFAAYHGPSWLLVVALVATVVGGGTLGALMGWLPRGEMFFVLALLVLSDIPIAWSELPLAIAAAAGSAALSVLLGVVWRPQDDRATLRLSELHRRAARGLASLDRRQHYVAVLAAAGGVLLAWLLATMLGVGHPFWAPVTVAALMPALASPEIYRRMAHLVLGTLLGVGLSAVLFSWKPNHLALITIIVLAQMATEVFIRRQYGVALVFLSPLAIGMSNLSRDLPWPPLLIDRATEASLGASVAFVVILLGRWLLTKVAERGVAGAIADFW
jgi:uncharacterized membrane protein YccC